MLRRTAIAASTCVLFATCAEALGGGIEPLTRQQVLPGGAVTRPVFVTHAPGDHSRIFIVEQRVGSTGRVRVYDLTTNQLLPTPFVSISGVTTANEQGLLGLAFHPNYEENGYFYVNFTNSSGTVIRRYTVSEDDPNVADASSLKTILTFSQPNWNHNGGWIGFGPDGYLYIATGDGGGAGDTQNNAQNLNRLLGKMLRIDVDVEDDQDPYLIPSDNPFQGSSVREEIWSYGLRNPWRASFDREFGDLYIGDVGQGSWEELNFQHANSTGRENWGWRCYEGNASFNTGGCPPPSSLEFPFHTYSLAGSPCAIVGGYAYRGCAIPSLSGAYFFADHCASSTSGNIWSLNYDRDNPDDPVSNLTNHSSTLGLGLVGITSFGEDAAGELYYTTLNSGVYRIVPVTPTIAPADLDCNGVVDVFDLLDLLAAWGDCSGCKADLDGSGAVDVFDLLDLLAAWG